MIYGIHKHIFNSSLFNLTLLQQGVALFAVDQDEAPASPAATAALVEIEDDNGF